MYFFRALGYSLEEALAGLWRNRLVNLVSIGTIAVTLFILGVFTAISTNLGRVVSGWSTKVQMTVYLDDTATAAHRNAIEERLRKERAVRSFEYLSKERALERFRGYFRELESLPEMLGGNPLPASFEIQMASEERDAGALSRLAAELQSEAGVDEVSYDRLWIERLTSIIDLVRLLALVIGTALVLAAAFTIFNVVKLTVYGRQEEIGIMRLVGATDGYIRGPFLVEGALQGGLGGAIALGFLFAAQRFLIEHVLTPSKLLVSPNWIRFPSTAWAILVLGGMVVGLLGSWLSVRKFLTSLA